MRLLQTVEAFCVAQGFANTYWVAYSGGVDSHALLHIFARLRTFHPIKLRAVYVNHGLSPNAEAWGKHCAQVCADLQIDFMQQSIDVNISAGSSLEALARERRYELFAQCMGLGDVLCTAHHQDDQAETLLLQMLRGAGPQGLAAMPSHKIFAQGVHCRPLLECTRQEIIAYAAQHQLSWIEDESNQNQHFSRNFMRHDIFPLLKTRWPSVSTTLARVAKNCAEAQALLNEMAAQDLASVQGELPHTLSISGLLQFNAARQRQILRAWLQALHFPLPSAVKLEQIQKEILSAAKDRMPCVQWGRVEVRRFQKQLYALPVLPTHSAQQTWSWDLQQPLPLPPIGELHAIAAEGKGLRADVTGISVRFRQGGETCLLPNRKGHHTLKKLFQEWAVPVWQRDRIPLIYVEETLAAVAGFCTTEPYMAGPREPSYILSWNSFPL